jgi:ABC-type bacteriocin/lantibiotic exporter with double-glycine peptidase domain
MAVKTRSKKSKDWAEAKPEKAIQKPDDTMQIVSRLMGYMTGDEARPKFILALALRILALLGLSVLPALTGQAIDVVTLRGASAELQKWITAALVAGILYLSFSFLADRVFGNLATRASYKLQNHLFSTMQTLSLSFF